MKVINSADEMQKTAESIRLQGKRIGFVPTMGYLHEGHLSLMRIARKQCDTLVCSIFVNPTQFGPDEDLDRYPRDFDRDERFCREENVDIVFYPSAKEMYPSGFSTYVLVENLGRKLCGISRPTHFRGVTTIVAKLFNLVKPHVAVFGQKDAQQFLILKRMVRDLNFDVDLMMGPIIREKDGLAMSSRNRYLTGRQREQATVLYKSLCTAEEMIAGGEKKAETILEKVKTVITSAPDARIDYVELVDPGNLEPLTVIGDSYLIAVAVYFDKTRLIDNILKTD